MAQGRMLNRKISLNKRVNDLSCDTSRLAFTWCIPFLDIEGRITGEPGVLRALIFPRRDDITTGQMRSYIREWATLSECGEGLVVWYKAKGELWLQFPGFDRNQPKLRKEREAASSIPNPEQGKIISVEAPEQLQIANSDDAGVTPDQLRINSGPTPNNVRKFNVTKELRADDDFSDGKASEHTRWAHDWYRLYTEKTARAVKPSPGQYAKAAQVMVEKGIDPETASAATVAYFDDKRDWWFAKEKGTGRRRYDFGNYLQHIEEIISALPHNGQKKLPKERPKCPACGQIQYGDTAGSCLECGLDMDKWTDTVAIEEAQRDHKRRTEANGPRP